MSATTLFSIHATPHPSWSGMGKPAVHAVPAVLSGIYSEGDADIVVPDHDAVREALPQQWRKAFERAGRFWYDNASRLDAEGKLTGGTPYLTLRGARGRVLATVYAIPYRFTPGHT